MAGIKTFFYLTLMTVLMVAVGSVFDAYFGGHGMIVGLFFLISLAMNVGTYWFSDTLVLKMHGAREVSPSEAPQLHEMVARLAGQAGLPMPKVCVVPSHVPNAFATGRNPRHAAVAVTEGILQALSADELEGVLAHELAHIKHRDTLLQTVVASMAGLVTMLAGQARWGLLLGGGQRREGGHPFAAIGMIFVALLAPLLAMVARAMISQQREYAADETGARISGNPLALASALRDIERAAAGAMGRRGTLGTPATEHLYFINHFQIGDVTSLLSTHPPTEKRIERLLAMAKRGTIRG